MDLPIQTILLASTTTYGNDAYNFTTVYLSGNIRTLFAGVPNIPMAEAANLISMHIPDDAVQIDELLNPGASPGFEPSLRDR